MIQEYLRELVALPGISSFERPVREYIVKHLKNTKADIKVNNLGCITATFEGKKKQLAPVLIDAHMDEIGFIVQHIDKNGFIRFVNYGGVDPRIIPNQRFEVHSRNGEVFLGVCGLLPPHVTAGKEAAVIPMDQLAIDCGFKSDEEVKKAGIRIGCAITFPDHFVELENNRISSKALDDRVGCALLMSTADYLNKHDQNRTVVLSFSTQEEIGAKGIISVVQKIKPEYALVVEGTIACDVQNVSDDKKVTRLGDGPAFTIADSSAFVDPEMVDFLIKIATKNKIQYQFKTPRYGGTNAGELYMVQDGVKMAIVAVPSRYIHSSVSVCDLADVKATETFIRKYIGEL